MDKLVKLIVKDDVWSKWVAANSTPAAGKEGCISKSKQCCISCG